MTGPFELVVFDLGGVLVRIARSWEEGHRLAGLAGAVPGDPAFESRLTELGAKADGSLTSARFCEEVAEASQGVYAVEDVRRISDAWLMGEYPGVGGIFDRLDEVDVATAILSNTNDAHWDRLAPASGDPEFPVVMRAGHRFASHLLGVMKPELPIYRILERETGYAPSQILFFDDTETNVAGARAAGWTAELIDPAGDTAAQLLAALSQRRVLGDPS